jgi:hypothetical protein
MHIFSNFFFLKYFLVDNLTNLKKNLSSQNCQEVNIATAIEQKLIAPNIVCLSYENLFKKFITLSYEVMILQKTSLFKKQSLSF